MIKISDFMRCSWSLCLQLSLSHVSESKPDYSVRSIFNSSLHSLVISTGPGDRSLYKILVDDGTTLKSGLYEYVLTYFLSVFSASLGLAKCLKNGVARTIGAGGCLDGLLSPRHLLAFFACGAYLMVRGVCLGVVTFVSNHCDTINT